jgi:hypothetical protein
MMKQRLILLIALVIVLVAVVHAESDAFNVEEDYVAPSTADKVFFLENFNEDPFKNNRWVMSKDSKYNGK